MPAVATAAGGASTASSPTRKGKKKFRDIKIESDSDIASVFFDHSFHADGKKTNRGKEAWHLVRTDEGWKIVSVIWSVNWTP